jgi:hydroxyacylglutathione hydrolase
MLLKRFYDEKLAQASYMVGCQATGEALVIDPHRDAELYVRAAAAEGLRITQITETHIHADFASGALELSQRTGARLLLSADGGPDWQYAFAARVEARLLRDGEAFMIGNLRVHAMHTPGHTPEHMTFLLTDTPATDRPIGAFTGDFVFVGDVGRPDLLEKAAGVMGTMEAGAGDLFRSLQRFKTLPDYLQIWPGHGAGSACGKALGAVPSSTIGYERLSNWAFRITDEQEFVSAVLSGQPDPPRYFAVMKTMNRVGPRVLGHRTHPPEISVEALVRILAQSAPVIDLRPVVEFARRHIPGTINIPENRSFTTWAGWLVPYDRPIALIGSSTQVDAAVRDLAMIGLDDIAGAADLRLVEEWAELGRPVGVIDQISVADLDRRLVAGPALVVDVRAQDEWVAGHIPQAINVPLGHLGESLGLLADQRPVYVQCESGARSSIAASLLRSLGLSEVYNVSGGIAAWRGAGLPVVRDAACRARARD